MQLIQFISVLDTNIQNTVACISTLNSTDINKMVRRIRFCRRKSPSRSTKINGIPVCVRAKIKPRQTTLAMIMPVLPAVMFSAATPIVFADVASLELLANLTDMRLPVAP